MTSLYEQRCNDSVARAKWLDSGLVRLHSLRPGDVFEAIEGQHFVCLREAYTGAMLVRAVGSNTEEWFPRLAMVRPIKEPK